MFRWCVVTTPADFSLNHFLDDSRSVDVYIYGHITEPVMQGYDVIYFRDPFNTAAYDLRSIEEDMAKVRTASPNAYIVDRAGQLSDVLLEDKWIQYQLFSAFMPLTSLASSGVVLKGELAKRRISSRGKGIYFEGSAVPGKTDDYIFQHRLDIENEYRCYVIDGRVVPSVAVRTSKTTETRVKTKKLIGIPEAVRRFVEAVYKSGPELDFVGYDIAVTESGLYLLEANRSPQFTLYNRLSHENLADSVRRSIERRL